MRRIDELHLDDPQPDVARAFESRRAANRTSSSHRADEEDGHRNDLPSPGHLETGTGSEGLSFLLRKLAVTRPNQVWVMDLTYISIPMARGFVGLCAVAGWLGRSCRDGCRSPWKRPSESRRSRKRLFAMASRRSSRTRVRRSVRRLHRRAEEGRGRDRHLDGRRVVGQFTERLWRSIKYEEVYITPTKPCPKPRGWHRPLSDLLQSCFITRIFLCY